MKKGKFDIISFHPGRSHNFEQAEQLGKHFKDFKTITSIYIPPQIIKYVNLFNKKLANQLRKRSYKFSRKGFVVVQPIYELERFIRNFFRLKINWDRRSESFQKWIIKKFSPPKIALGFDSSSRLIFQEWKNKSICILDLGIAIPQYRVKIKHGNEFTLKDLKKEPHKKQELFARYNEELNLADLILCGSAFVKSSCVEFGVDEKKLIVLPYGVEVEKFDNPNKRFNTSSKEVHFVFIGAFGYRKGGDILLRVWKKVKNEFPQCTLTVFGSVQIDVSQYTDIIEFKGHVPQSDMIRSCQEKDVLVFPSSFEGSSLSIYQSMAMKLTILATYNSGSVIEDGISGLIIPYGDESILYEKMKELIIDPGIRIRLAENGYSLVHKYTWNDYGIKLKEIIKKYMK